MENLNNINFLSEPIKITEHNWSNNTLPFLSICCSTYNHENFISQAINSILSQKTNFEVELIIYDDSSTDNTKQIINEFVIKYPRIIKPIFQKENQYSKGINVVTKFIFPFCKGKYIAMCEGDDYWTDPYKLQKQVDILESNPELSGCFHKVRVQKELRNSHYPDFNPLKLNKQTITLKDLLKRNIVSSCSYLYRGNLKKDFPEEFRDWIFGDWFRHILNLENGNYYYIDDIMAVYRVHNAGYWSVYSSSIAGRIKEMEINILTYNLFQRYFKKRYFKYIEFIKLKSCLKLQVLYLIKFNIKKIIKIEIKILKSLYSLIVG